MEKYSVKECIGRGSYGIVHKAVLKSQNQVVALKFITKKNQKNIHFLRQEFEIQRCLRHPNIIRMLESFETIDEIVVVTEFAPQDLSQELKKQQKGCFSEKRVQSLVCDLLSALYYLHYHRVIHRDLKPQNILVESDGTAKLCDFGFARSMSMDTFLLNSFKGTPLYMAPEIIVGDPYDHSADLWSLGCIVYECIVGSPPFNELALFHLLKSIQEEIKWPESVSTDCLSFLRGLLEKDSSKRFRWPDLLDHPFVGKINLGNVPSNATVVVPLTHPLTASQTLAKEKQKKDLICHLAGKTRNYAESAKYFEQRENKHMVLQELQSHVKTRVCLESPEENNKSPTSKTLFGHANGNVIAHPAPSTADHHTYFNPSAIPQNTPEKNRFCTAPLLKTQTGVQTQELEIEKLDDSLLIVNKPPVPVNTQDKVADDSSAASATVLDETELPAEDAKYKTEGQSLLSWISKDNPQPIECEEWLFFLQKTMEEVMDGEVDVMKQENFVAMLVSHLRNPHASSKVIEYVACLLSLPFVVNGVHDDTLARIKEVYLTVKVVPHLVYASNLLTQQKFCSADPDVEDTQSLRPVSDLGADELHAMECIYLLLCNLTHLCDDFLVQFCDAVAIFTNGVALLQQLLLLGRRKARIVADLLAILAHILRILPENAILVEQIALGSGEEEKGKDLGRILTNKCPLLRSRCCHLLRLLGRCSFHALQNAWSLQLRCDLENLRSDSSDLVREAAEETVSKLKGLVFYEGQSRPKR